MVVIKILDGEYVELPIVLTISGHIKNIRSGKYRKLFGLESDMGCNYRDLRKKGLSDIEAQLETYYKRGLIKIKPDLRKMK